jgi:hypothetical protein
LDFCFKYFLFANYKYGGCTHISCWLYIYTKYTLCGASSIHLLLLFCFQVMVSL